MERTPRPVAGQRGQARPAPALVRAPGPKPGTAEFFAQIERQMLAATFWFDPAEGRTSGSVVVRFTGHRKGVGAKTRPGDQFVQDERVDDVRPDSGPISVTTRVRGINPGEWIVSAKFVSPDPSGRSARVRPGAIPGAATLHPGGWSWRSWSFRRIEAAPPTVRTVLEPFARVPGMLPLAWGATALTGFVVALATQQALLVRVGIAAGDGLKISLIAIAAGLVGSQVRFWLDHRREGRFLGWAVQGFLTATAVAGVAALVIARLPIGPFIDVSAPGILFGLAIGRTGCFVGGCCYGRPTASRWGVWSTDQRIGRRRIPTQLLESAVSLLVGIAALAAILAGAPLRGGIFVGALAAYTLARQGILHLRGERAAFGFGGTITSAAALVVLIAAVAYVVLWPGG